MSRPKILVIDDDPELLKLIDLVYARHLPKAAILRAIGGVEGICLATSERPDLILLDDMMPFPTGYDVLSTLKERQVAARVVMMTARTITARLMIGFIRAGACDYLCKPFSPGDLIEKTRQALSLKNADLTVVSNLTPLLDQIFARAEYPGYEKLLKANAVLLVASRN